ncbi:ATP-dependent helicase HrpB, partial [Streptomyces sp. SID14478]|nr:ATP-dependent helicase HrpB [Streptomyces sp. SID14478]
ARAVLSAVGAVDGASGQVTRRGTRLARLGLHPRLGRALLDAAPVVGARRAAEAVALLSEEPPREYGDDLGGALRTARRGGDAYSGRWRTEVRRLSGLVASSAPAEPEPVQAPGDDDVAGLVAALAFPERIARKSGGSYLMVSGTRADIGDGSALRHADWVAVAVADRPVGA